MARPKKQLNRRADILDAAQKLFIEKGFEKTTLDEIARHIGIGKGSIYLDFKNKDDIYLALIDRYAIKALEQFEFKIAEAKDNYLELLKKVLQTHLLDVFDMATSHVRSYVALLHANYQIKQKLNHLMERWLGIISTLLKRAEANNEIKLTVDSDYLAYLIHVSVQGFFPPYDLKYSPDHRTDLTKEEIRELLLKDVCIVTEMIIDGLKLSKYVDNPEKTSVIKR